MRRNDRTTILLAYWTCAAGAYLLLTPAEANAADACGAYVPQICWGSGTTLEDVLEYCNNGNQCGYTSSVSWWEAGCNKRSCANN